MKEQLEQIKANALTALEAAATPAALEELRVKLLGKKGWFYTVAGPKARGIDGPTEGTIPPYDHYVVLTPADPMGTSRRLAQALGHPVAIVDINDLEGQILGVSSKALDKHLYARILKDNPLGQDDQQTPMGIIRKL